MREGSPFLRLEAVVAGAGQRHDISLALAPGEPRRIRVDGARAAVARRAGRPVRVPGVPAGAPRRRAARAGGAACVPRPAPWCGPSPATPPRCSPTATPWRSATRLLRRIRAGAAAADALDPWDEQLALHGAALIAARARLCARPGRAVRRASRGARRPQRRGARLPAARAGRRARRRHRRAPRRATSSGPRPAPARTWTTSCCTSTPASCARSARRASSARRVLALLLAEAEPASPSCAARRRCCCSTTCCRELDADRRARLVRAVRDVGQAIVTTTEAAHLPEPADRVLRRRRRRDYAAGVKRVARPAGSDAAALVRRGVAAADPAGLARRGRARRWRGRRGRPG